MKRELCQLAQTYDYTKHAINGWMVSQKLDGVRAIWDSGVSRGIPASSVPWANVSKDGRFKEEQIATGLWSRYGKVIHAPDWFLDKLPPFLLDGELYAGIGSFQTLISTVKTIVPGPGWRNVRYMVFDSPPAERLFADGAINNTNFKKHLLGCWEWWSHRAAVISRPQQFESLYKWLSGELVCNDVVSLLEQERLPVDSVAANEMLTERLMTVTTAGGEGLILRQPTSIWTPERSWNLLKVKRMQDAEGVVVGYRAGKERLLGLMGSLTVGYNGVEFDLSGFTEEERVMVVIGESDSEEEAKKWLSNIPGGVVPPGTVHNEKFLLGSTVSFKFRELTNGNKPKEARYYRKS